jgi:hypothetical protein
MITHDILRWHPSTTYFRHEFIQRLPLALCRNPALATEHSTLWVVQQATNHYPTSPDSGERKSKGTRKQ